MLTPLYQTVENVTAVARGETTIGSLKLTDHHIIFTAPPRNADSAANDHTERSREIWLAYPMLSGGEFRPTAPASSSQPGMRLRARDFYFINLHFPDNKTAQDAFNFIKARACRLGSIEKLYAFSYRTHPKERNVRGWALYNIRDEFRRQGISDKLRDRGWRITDINKDYSFCPTYPSVLVVPTKIKDPTLKHAGKHRTRCRVPTLTYLHPINNCSITRSSQPRVGLTGNRNPQDEALVAACFSNPYFEELPDMPDTEAPDAPEHDSISSNKNQTDASGSDQTDTVILRAADATFDDTGKRLVFGAQQHNLIIDARPAINSMAMQLVGKGSESMENYNFASKAYLNIQNIHVMRASLEKVVSALKHGDISDGKPSQDLLLKSNWLKHIKGVLDGSALIARQVGIQHSHVLIHCSDGWDRTSQLSALSQLMLDPYYRTLKGFMVLVEKDWLSFGHMFQQRSGFLNYEKWFVVQNDAMAGGTMESGEGEGPAEILDKTFEGAKRLFTQILNSDKEKDTEESDVDGLPEQESSVVEDQATKPKEMSPVFHQFLDSVYQLVRQHPSRFEFNERFLRRLFYHMYSCQYGTFLLNNEKQRKDAKLHETTTSVWDYFLSRQDTFINPDYDPKVDDNVRGQERLIFPRLDGIRWWHQLFGRTDSEMNSGLDEEAARKDRVAETVESMNASPHPGNSPPDSEAGTPQPAAGHQLPFGNMVLAGIEVPRANRNTGETGGAQGSLAKGLAGLGLRGPGEASMSVGSTGDAVHEQEMSSMSGTGNVAP